MTPEMTQLKLVPDEAMCMTPCKHETSGHHTREVKGGLDSARGQTIILTGFLLLEDINMHGSPVLSSNLLYGLRSAGHFSPSADATCIASIYVQTLFVTLDTPRLCTSQ